MSELFELAGVADQYVVRAGLARPESITFLAPLTLAFAEDFLTGWESFFAMVVRRV